MKISICVPVYNTEKYLIDCLQSIKNQTFKDFEVILIDDGSTDSSAEICDEFAKKDSRFKVFHKRINEGLPYARRDGIENASGDYVTFIDSDDYWDLNFLETVIPHTEKDYEVIQWGLKKEYINRNFETYVWQSTWNLNDLLRLDSVLWHAYSTKMVKRSVFEKNKFLFEKNIFVGEDLCFSVQLYSYCKNIFNIQNYAPYHYRFYDNNMSKMTVSKLDNNKEAIIFIESFLKDKQNIMWEEMIRMKKETLKMRYITSLSQPDCNAFRNTFPEIKKIHKASIKRKVVFYLASLYLDFLVIILFNVKYKKNRLYEVI